MRLASYANVIAAAAELKLENLERLMTTGRDRDHRAPGTNGNGNGGDGSEPKSGPRTSQLAFGVLFYIGFVLAMGFARKFLDAGDPFSGVLSLVLIAALPILMWRHLRR
jgi:hypothetical protein